MKNQKNYQCHPEGDNHVARSDEHDREKEQGPEHNVLKERFLGGCDRHDHEPTSKVEENIGETENVGIHVNFMNRRQNRV